MFSLFKIEWLKIKTYRTFWILFSSFLVFFPVAFYFSASKYMNAMGGRGSLQEEMLKSMLSSPFVFPRVWLAASWMGGLFFVLIGMLFILLVTNEVQYRTHRQNIIDGWSRMDFLKAKFSLLIFFVLVSTALVFIMGLVVGSVFSSSQSNMFEGVLCRLFYVNGNPVPGACFFSCHPGKTNRFVHHHLLCISMYS